MSSFYNPYQKGIAWGQGLSGIGDEMAMKKKMAMMMAMMGMGGGGQTPIAEPQMGPNMPMNNLQGPGMTPPPGAMATPGGMGGDPKQQQMNAFMEYLKRRGFVGSNPMGM